MSPIDRQAEIDARVLAYYGHEFDEEERLGSRSPQGPLELLRTLEIVRARFTSGRVVDIGGGTGRYARALLALGSEVELIDPVPRHIEAASAAGVSARLGDARAVPFEDASFDAALVLGPMYHLAARSDRLVALREAARVTRPGGFVFVGALSRLVALTEVHLAAPDPSSLPQDVAALLAEGAPVRGRRFPAGHLHTADELQSELEAAGLDVLEVVGVEGPGGALLESSPDASQELLDAALLLARSGAASAVRELSAHLLAVGVVRAPDSSEPAPRD